MQLIKQQLICLHRYRRQYRNQSLLRGEGLWRPRYNNIFTDCIIKGGNAIVLVRLSVRLFSIFLQDRSTVDFELLRVSMGHDHSSQGIKGQGHRSRSGSCGRSDLDRGQFFSSLAVKRSSDNKYWAGVLLLLLLLLGDNGLWTLTAYGAAQLLNTLGLVIIASSQRRTSLAI